VVCLTRTSRYRSKKWSWLVPLLPTGGRGIEGGGMTVATEGAAAGASPSPAARIAPSTGPTSGKAVAGAAGDGHRDGAPPGQPSQIPGPEPGGRAAGGSGGRHNGPPVPLPPSCGAVPPAAEEKNDLMRKLAELDTEDAKDDESAPPSPTPV
jgi:hypothetical protein